MGDAGEWEKEVRERKEECRYVMTVKHICSIIGDEPSDECKETLKECEEMCRYIVTAEYLYDYDFKSCHLRDGWLYLWTEDVGWQVAIQETIPLCDEPVHGIARWELCPDDEALLFRLRRKECKEPFEIEIMRFWFDADGTMRSKVIDKLVLDPDKAWELLDKLSGNKEKDVGKLLNELKIAIGLQPAGGSSP